MRLVCPKCVAQYEVDDNAVPESGREVQCANCEHIWWQDSVKMLRDKEEAAQLLADTKENETIFDDLNGVSESQFSTSRDSQSPELGDPADTLIDDRNHTDGDGVDEEDDEPRAVPSRKLDDHVLDVLRQEVAFSTAREKLDAGTAQAIDDGVHSEGLPRDELSAFLDAHGDAEQNDQPEEPSAGTIAPPAEPIQEPAEDPLADLDAIRTQLDQLSDLPKDDDSGDVQTGDYTTVLPQDDPAPKRFEQPILRKPADDYQPDDVAEPIYDSPDDDVPHTEAVVANEPPQVDDTPNDRPRRAFRADMEPMTEQAEDRPQVDDSVLLEAEPDLEPQENPETSTSNKDIRAAMDAAQDDSEALEGVAAATTLGMSRPRPKSTRGRARTMPAVDESLHDKPRSGVQEQLDDPENFDPPVDTPQSDQREGRAALLPDVDELDASLRTKSNRQRTAEIDAEMGTNQTEPKGSFNRAFIWTVFIVALLLAAYVFRPQILAFVPAASVVLDPYVAVIDGLRLQVDAIVGKFL